MTGQARADTWSAALQTCSGSALPADLVKDLRTDHAGETGAVMIYRGILAVSRDDAARRFAEHHLRTEQTHLAAMETLLPVRERSRLLPLWRLAGWMTGALPALAGPQAIYATINAVETFVDLHYAQQIAWIERIDPCCRDEPLLRLRELLQICREDEVAHRDEAKSLLSSPAGAQSVALRIWAWLVGAGSSGAVKVCRWI